MRISTCRRGTYLLAVASLLFAAPAWAGPLIVSVGPPSGGDDTQALQSALDRCVASGRKCTVQLGAGTYMTRQLVAYNFRGTFAGAGQNSTFVEPFGTLSVCQANLCGWKPPDTTTNLWPDLVIFVNGDVTVSDMSFRLTTTPATTGWYLRTRLRYGLVSAIRVLGSQPTAASIRRVGITGASDPQFGWYGGLYNVLNCVIVASELPRPGADPNTCNVFDPTSAAACTYPLTGAFDFESSSFQTCGSGLGIARLVRSHVSIGGSTTKGNIFADNAFGIELGNNEESMFDVSQNSIDDSWSLNLIVYNPYYPAQAASTYVIHNNSLDVGGPGGFADGIYLEDNDLSVNGSSLKVIDAAVVNNKVRAENDQFGLIHAFFTDGTLIALNELSGTSVPNFDYGAASDPFGGIVVQYWPPSSRSGTHPFTRKRKGPVYRCCQNSLSSFCSCRASRGSSTNPRRRSFFSVSTISACETRAW